MILFDIQSSFSYLFFSVGFLFLLFFNVIQSWRNSLHLFPRDLSSLAKCHHTTLLTLLSLERALVARTWEWWLFKMSSIIIGCRLKDNLFNNQTKSICGFANPLSSLDLDWVLRVGTGLKNDRNRVKFGQRKKVWKNVGIISAKSKFMCLKSEIWNHY